MDRGVTVASRERFTREFRHKCHLRPSRLVRLGQAADACSFFRPERLGGVGSPSVAGNSAVNALVADIIDRHNVRTVFQPLVHVASLEVVGFEALTRGPER